MKRARRKPGQSHQARKGPLEKTSKDPAAETGTKVGEQHPKIKTKKQIRKGPEKGVGVRRGRSSGEGAPGRRGGGPEAQTGVRLETLTEADALEADALEAEAVGETAAKTDPLRETTDAGNLATGGGDVVVAVAAVAAAAPIATGGKKRAAKVPILQREINPETREARPDQIVQRTKRGKIARKITQAPARTATDHFFFSSSIKIG